MAKRLTRTVFIGGVAYGPSSVIPADIAAQITNPKVWADADASASAPAGVVADDANTDPAAGADVPVPDAETTVKELRDYAKAKGITLGAAKTKPEILKVLGLADPEEDAQGADGDREPAGSEVDEVPEADSPEDVDGEPADPDADGEPAGADAE